MPKKTLRKTVRGKKAQGKSIHQEIRHLGVVIERVDDNVKLVAEQYGDVKKEITDVKKDVGGLKNNVDKLAVEVVGIKETLDTHTDMLGSVKMDIEIIKTDIEFIKQGFKKKVDVDEFAALERRVSLLEKRR